VGKGRSSTSPGWPEPPSDRVGRQLVCRRRARAQPGRAAGHKVLPYPGWADPFFWSRLSDKGTRQDPTPRPRGRLVAATMSRAEDYGAPSSQSSAVEVFNSVRSMKKCALCRKTPFVPFVDAIRTVAVCAPELTLAHQVY